MDDRPIAELGDAAASTRRGMPPGAARLARNIRRHDAASSSDVVRSHHLRRERAAVSKPKVAAPFVFSPRDPNFAHIEKENAVGRNLYKTWLDYVPRVDKPLSLKKFYARFAAWRAAGKPTQFSRGADGSPVNVVSDTPLQGTKQSKRSGSASEALLTVGGLAFIDQSGVALQVRRQALCLRFPDGSEQLLQSRDHKLKTIILAASASISTDAVQWLATERVGLLIANKSLTGFSVFAHEPTLENNKNPLALRRKQFAANPFEIARHVVRLKIETFGLSSSDQTVFAGRLASAKTVSDVIVVEARASAIYWRRWKGFELTFKVRPPVPDSWRIFLTRGNAATLKRNASAARFHQNRTAINPTNAMLNYGYAVALAQVTRAICGLGLDPAYGFLHADKIGRVSFAYDALELLRVRVDELVFNCAGSRRFERGVDFVEFEGAHVRLSAVLAREIAALVLRGISFHECENAVMTIARMF